MPERFFHNGRPTELGKKAQQLVLADEQLRNHQNPDVAFAMSDLMVAKAKVTRENVLVDFGIKEDDATKELTRIRRKLARSGHPHYRVGDFNDKSL